MNIPENTKDDKCERMDRFVEYVLKELTQSDYAEIYDEARCNGERSGLPGITYSEARELARMFAAKGYHASAYYIDCPSHGFRNVTISRHVCQESCHRCSHTEVWA